MDKTTKNDKNIIQITTVPSVLNLIYPPTCGICGKLDTNFLCNKCYKVLKKEAIYGIEKNQNEENLFDEHFYIFKYEGIIRKLILQYKFQDKSYLYKTFTNFLLKNEKFFQILKSYDTIIPVPISKKRYRERGYNQSYLLAKEIAKNIEIQLENDCLLKKINIVEQSKLNKENRVKNIQGVYELRNDKRLRKKSILLFDDIYTTGSTVNECCKILKKGYPIKIGVLTIAKD